MKKILFSSILIFIFYFFVTGQDKPWCPSISISGPDDLAPSGQPSIIKVTVSGVSLDKIGYVWSVTRGKIVEGQGTSVLKALDTEEGFAAIVKITGLLDSCQNSVSISYINEHFLPTSSKIDEFSLSPPHISRHRLDGLFVALNNDPAATGYILETFKRGTSRLQIEQKLSKLLAAFKFRKISTERVKLVINTGNKNLTELWIAPLGAAPPPISENAALVDMSNYKRDLAKIFSAKAFKTGKN